MAIESGNAKEVTVEGQEAPAEKVHAAGLRDDGLSSEDFREPFKRDKEIDTTVAENHFGTVQIGSDRGYVTAAESNRRDFYEKIDSPRLAENFESMVKDGSLATRMLFLDRSGLHHTARRFAELPDNLRKIAEKELTDIDPMWATQMKLAVAGVPDRAADFDPQKYKGPMTVGAPTDFWTGSGITGVNPTKAPMSWGTFIKLGMERKGLGFDGTAEAFRRFTYRADKETLEVPSDPNDAEAIQKFFDEAPKVEERERLRFAEVFLKQPISTVNPEAYDGKIPSRADVLKAAGKLHGVDPRIVAGFLLSEQSEQSQNEDAMDYQAAAWAGHNTSVGIAQIQVRNATHDGGKLLDGTVDADTRRTMSHADAARFLASDEHAIFAAAKFIRELADAGAKKFAKPGSLPATRAQFPDMDYSALGKDSSYWTSEHVLLLGSEYTSTPWDDDLKNMKGQKGGSWGHRVLNFTNAAFKFPELRLPED